VLVNTNQIMRGGDIMNAKDLGCLPFQGMSDAGQ
jgi:hypothetical protein